MCRTGKKDCLDDSSVGEQIGLASFIKIRELRMKLEHFLTLILTQR